MKGMRKVMLMAIALVLAMAAEAAVTYRTPELKRLARIAGVAENALVPGDNHKNGCTIRVDDNMNVRHVGLTLFSEEVKRTGNRMVLEFVERYFLQLAHPAPNSTAALMMRSDGITFPKGNWQDIKRINTKTPFSLDYKLMRYTLSWQTGGYTLSFSFPGKYQLISGDNLPQAEEHLPDDIRSTPHNSHPMVDETQLQQSSMHGYYIRRGGWYNLETVNATTYYRKMGNGSFAPVVDADFIEESVADIMMCNAAAETFTLNITMHRYGYKDAQFDVPLSQWIDYCEQNGCVIYCGIETVKPEGVRATVMAVNQRLNFNHLLTVNIPLEAIENGKGTVMAELNAFIPTHNIININGKYKKANKPENKILRNI